MIQLSPLYIDKQTKVLHNTQEGKCCVLRSQSLESTGSLGVYAIGSLPTAPTIAPESRSKSQTVLSNTKLPILDSYVPTVHFLLHYFSTFLCLRFPFYRYLFDHLRSWTKPLFIRHYIYTINTRIKQCQVEI